MTKKSEANTGILINGLINGQHIATIAKRMGVTVSDLSYAIGRECRKSKKVAEKLAKYNLPMNITSGYIFLGDFLKTTSEKDSPLLLQPGFHVLGKKIQRARDRFGSKEIRYEIFNPVRVIEQKFKLYWVKPSSENPDKLSRSPMESVWISENKVEKQGLKELAYEFGKEKGMKQDRTHFCMLIKQNRTRLRYKRGKFLDNVSSRAVVSVHSNFK